jgi:hypothetical protein
LITRKNEKQCFEIFFETIDFSGRCKHCYKNGVSDAPRLKLAVAWQC